MMSDGDDEVLEGSSGGESAQGSMNGTMTSGPQEEALLKEADSTEPTAVELEAPSSGVD